MIKKILCLFLILGGFVYQVSAQQYCQKILKQAREAFNEDNYSDALTKLQDAEVCDYKNSLIKERQQLQKDIFDAIQQQKVKAERDRQAAIRAKQEAEQKTFEARVTTLIAKGREWSKTDATRALNLGLAAYKGSLNANQQFPSEESANLIEASASLIYDLSVSNFYEKQLSLPAYFSSYDYALDGTHFLGIDQSQTLGLWDLETGKFWISPQKASVACFSYDGQEVYAAHGHSIHVLDLSGQELRTFQLKDSIGNLIVSPDGEFILAGAISEAYMPAMAYLMDRQGRLIKELSVGGESIDQMNFSPDGSSVLFRVSEPFEHMVISSAWVWNIADNLKAEQENQNLEGRMQAKGAEQDAEIASLSYSTDGQYVLLGGTDSIGIVYDSSGKELFTLEGHEAAVTAIGMSPDGELIITGCGDGTFRFWDKTGKESGYFFGHEGPVRQIVFSKDGKQFLTGGADGAVKLWNLKGQEVERFLGHRFAISLLSFTPDERSIITGDEESVKIWNYQDQNVRLFGEPIDYPLYYHKLPNPMESAIFSHAGDQVLTRMRQDGFQSSNDGYEEEGSPAKVRLWNLDGSEVSEFGQKYLTGNVCAFSANDESVIIAGDSLFNFYTKQGELIKSLDQIIVEDQEIYFSDDGSQLFGLGRDGLMQVWELNGRKKRQFQMRPPRLDYDGLSQVRIALSQNSQYLLWADSVVEYWSTTGGRIRVYEDWVYQEDSEESAYSPYGPRYHYSLAISPSGKEFLVGNHAGKLGLLDMKGKELWEDIQYASGLPVSSVAFSPDGNYILAGLGDRPPALYTPGRGHPFPGENTLDFLDRHGNEMQQFPGIEHQVLSVTFSPDGQYILAGCGDGTAKLWRNIIWALENGKIYHFSEMETSVYDIDWDY